MTMKCVIGTKQGFTLIEMIVVMIIVGIISAVAGMGIVHIVQGMIFTKMNAATIQKGQITMTKLVKEFSNISVVTAAGVGSIAFTSVKGGASGSNTVAFVGNAITFDGDILTDQVSDFALSYYDNYDALPQTTWQSSRRIIEITLKLTGAGGNVSEFKERVKPRNLQ